MSEKNFAEVLSDGKIKNIIVATPEFIETLDGTWIECTNDIKARRDGTYDFINKRFVEPKPYSNWILDTDGNWQPPVPKPEQDPQLYKWDQDTNSWILIGERNIDN